MSTQTRLLQRETTDEFLPPPPSPQSNINTERHAHSQNRQAIERQSDPYPTGSSTFATIAVGGPYHEPASTSASTSATSSFSTLATSTTPAYTTPTTPEYSTPTNYPSFDHDSGLKVGLGLGIPFVAVLAAGAVYFGLQYRHNNAAAAAAATQTTASSDGISNSGNLIRPCPSNSISSHYRGGGGGANCSQTRLAQPLSLRPMTPIELEGGGPGAWFELV
ncbi:hypothetical protein B0H63DRAFT_528706 [Podospora didyma]|uniref:Uncharacterized protein n=1 Tax=Podospora didyma TaxID=330526 RepID=A0AAE0N328_9PEZI|nr:hypothetical protein B0H63DRAFT_528706 [Podospora didyma]